MTPMAPSPKSSVSAKPVREDPYGSYALVKRLIADQGLTHWRRYLIALVLMAISAAATALSAYLLRDVINAAYVQKNLNLIVSLALLTAFLFMAKGAATYGHSVILARIANAIVAQNQRRLFAKLMHENAAFFSDRHSSEFLTRMSTGATSIAFLLNLLITSVGRDLLTLIGLMIVMVVQDPVMALAGLLIAPPAVIFIRKMIRRIKNLALSQFEGNASIQETMLEALQGLRTVKAFTLEDAMQQRMETNVAALEANANKMARISNRANPLMEMLGGFAVCATLIYAGYRVVVTGATPGEFFSFLTAFLLAYEPAKRLARFNIELNGALVGARTLIEVIDAPDGESDDSDRPALALKNAHVEFRDVTFGYRPNELVLRSASLSAEPGKVTALVGPSGGGKSTVLNLLLRLYDISTGAILIDGQNIADISRKSLRRSIAYVGQDVFLFRGSIRANIAFGKPGATEAEIIAAASAACAHDFIMSFPRGYETPVGEHGAQLSGGQKQRIAIARALVKDAPLVLLDEPTAALDSESEQHVQQAIEHLCRGRTTLVIAHRLHTIKHADTIHVIEGGQVVESGDHDTLLRRGGRYATIYRLQYHDERPVPLAPDTP